MARYHLVLHVQYTQTWSEQFAAFAKALQEQNISITDQGEADLNDAEVIVVFDAALKYGIKLFLRKV